MVYLVIVQGVLCCPRSARTATRYGEFPDIASVLRFLWLPIGISAIFVVGVVTWLGWWRPVWVVPALMALAILVGANYAELADRGLGYVAVASSARSSSASARRRCSAGSP